MIYEVFWLSRERNQPQTMLSIPASKASRRTQCHRARTTEPAELHNLAAHAHAAAATAHCKGDRLTAHELSKQAHEYSVIAHKHSEDLAIKTATPNKG